MCVLFGFCHGGPLLVADTGLGWTRRRRQARVWFEGLELAQRKAPTSRPDQLASLRRYASYARERRGRVDAPHGRTIEGPTRLRTR